MKFYNTLSMDVLLHQFSSVQLFFYVNQFKFFESWENLNRFSSVHTFNQFMKKMVKNGKKWQKNAIFWHFLAILNWLKVVNWTELNLTERFSSVQNCSNFSSEKARFFLDFFWEKCDWLKSWRFKNQFKASSKMVNFTKIIIFFPKS